MFTSNREALRELVVRLAIRRGPITLSNGSVSAYYFDCKRLTLDSDGAAEVSVAMTEVIAGLSPRPLAIGGLWLWMFFTQLAQRPLLAFRDPYLREALESTGGH